MFKTCDLFAKITISKQLTFGSTYSKNFDAKKEEFDKIRTNNACNWSYINQYEKERQKCYIHVDTHGYIYKLSALLSKRNDQVERYMSVLYEARFKSNARRKGLALNKVQIQPRSDFRNNEIATVDITKQL